VSPPSTSPISKRRLGILLAGPIAIALAVWVILTVPGRWGVVRGSALDTESEGGILQPLLPGQPVSLGIVGTRNVSRDPIELVGARLLRVDPDVEVLGFGAVAEGPGIPITALEYPLNFPGVVPVDKFPPIGPAPDEHPQVVVTFGLKVRPGGEGKAVGVAVRYRQRGRFKEQVFRQQVFVCTITSADQHDCPGHKDPMAVFGDFDDEVRGKSGKR
jgi:hypothetical protein